MTSIEAVKVQLTVEHPERQTSPCDKTQPVQLVTATLSPSSSPPPSLTGRVSSNIERGASGGGCRQATPATPTLEGLAQHFPEVFGAKSADSLRELKRIQAARRTQLITLRSGDQAKKRKTIRGKLNKTQRELEDLQSLVTLYRAICHGDTQSVFELFKQVHLDTKYAKALNTLYKVFFNGHQQAFTHEYIVVGIHWAHWLQRRKLLTATSESEFILLEKLARSAADSGQDSAIVIFWIALCYRVLPSINTGCVVAMLARTFNIDQQELVSQRFVVDEAFRERLWQVGLGLSSNGWLGLVLADQLYLILSQCDVSHAALWQLRYKIVRMVHRGGDKGIGWPFAPPRSYSIALEQLSPFPVHHRSIPRSVYLTHLPQLHVSKDEEGVYTWNIYPLSQIGRGGTASFLYVEALPEGYEHVPEDEAARLGIHQAPSQHGVALPVRALVRRFHSKVAKAK